MKHRSRGAFLALDIVDIHASVAPGGKNSPSWVLPKDTAFGAYWIRVNRS